MSEYKLFQEIIKRSNADNWDDAVKEWVIDRIEYSSEPRRCLCGHYPINELCFLKSKVNLNYALVGNCCVKKFFGLDYSKVFIAISKRKINKAVIEYAHEKNIINDWERGFMLDVWRKRRFSQKQLLKFEGISKRIQDKIIK